MLRLIAVSVTCTLCPAVAQPSQKLVIPVRTLAACDVAFELPKAYRIKKPERGGDTNDAARFCRFEIVPSQPEPRERGECKNEADGGTPPYRRCDWYLARHFPDNQSRVTVIRARLDDHTVFDGEIYFDDGAWRFTNVQSGDDRAEPIVFFGKTGWRGEPSYRMYWERRHTRQSPPIYAGSEGPEVTLFQLTSELAIELLNPPSDTDNSGECIVFCSSLREANSEQKHVRHR